MRNGESNVVFVSSNSSRIKVEPRGEVECLDMRRNNEQMAFLKKTQQKDQITYPDEREEKGEKYLIFNRDRRRLSFSTLSELPRAEKYLLR